MLGRSTPWSVERIPDQQGRTAVVTGANAGVGYHTALELVRRGARVVMGCRDAKRAGEAAARIEAEVPTAQLEVRHLDLADLSSVTGFAQDVARDHERIDVLVNNAGLMAPERRETADRFELHFGVNYLGHFALTGLLLPTLLRAPGSRVVMTTSMTYRFGKLVLDDLMFERRGYGMWPAYFQSKLANLLFGLELNRRLAAAGAATLAVSAHPGMARTEIGPKAGLGGGRGSALIGRLITQSAAEGAQPTLRAATAPDVNGGDFFGPRFRCFGPAVREKIKRSVVAPDTARSLWEVSTELVGVAPLVPA